MALTIQFNVPDRILNIDNDILSRSTREAVLAVLKQEYDKLVRQMEDHADQEKQGRNDKEIKQIQKAFSEAMQQLGQVYNREVDTITAYYRDKDAAKQANSAGSSPGAKTDNQNQNNSFYNNRFKELRNTPGYQNYVVEQGKTVNGLTDSLVYKKYYSDTSAELYFNGHWLEDINAVQWQVQRQTYPLFGYNSFIYDDVALGNRIIYGAFTINFTEPDRLRNIISQNKIEAVSNTDTVSYEEYAKKIHETKLIIDGNKTEIINNDAHATIWSPRFDIDVVFGESDPLGASVILPKHIILWDCHLMGSQIMTSTNDGVLQESYQFLARDFKVIK